MKVGLCHLQFLCADLDMGNVCPACPKVQYIIVLQSRHKVYFLLQQSGQMMISMDALWFASKKSAGQSFREAIHGHLFFRQQSEFVALGSSKHKKLPKEV